MNALLQFVEQLKRNNELIQIDVFVDPILEIAEIADRISKAAPQQNKALLFTNTGTPYPLLINAYGSERRMSMALNVTHLDDIAKRIDTLLEKVSKAPRGFMDKLSLLPQLKQMSDWMPKTSKKRGECQEIIDLNPDLFSLPVLKCWPHDGGRFITLPIIHTQNPYNGIRNVGMYRMQLFEKNLAALHWHKHKVSAKHYEMYKLLKKRMPVAVALGGDPIYAYVSTAPLPENIDEYIMAGFLRNKAVELVSCITQPEVLVPADADFIIEGYVDPEEDLILEGPFGDHTGFYSLADYYPRFHVTAITQKKNAIYPATIVGIPPQEDTWIGKATERIFLSPMRMTMLPEIVDMNMPLEGVFHNLVLASIHKTYAGQGFKTMNSLWGAGQMMFNKVLVVFDQHIDLNNTAHLVQLFAERFDPLSSIILQPGPMDVLDHSSKQKGLGSKLGIDLTEKTEEEIGIPLKLKSCRVDEKALLKTYKWIHALNATLAAQQIPVLLMSVDKKRMNLKQLKKLVEEENLIQGIRMMIYFDPTVPVDKVSVAIWIALNNIDPMRDIDICSWNTEKENSSCLFIDATMKTSQDGFYRDWPNIITSSSETIKSIDAKWADLGLGDFIASPSLLFQSMLTEQSAIASANTKEKS